MGWQVLDCRRWFRIQMGLPSFMRSTSRTIETPNSNAKHRASSYFLSSWRRILELSVESRPNSFDSGWQQKWDHQLDFRRPVLSRAFKQLSIGRQREQYSAWHRSRSRAYPVPIDGNDPGNWSVYLASWLLSFIVLGFLLVVDDLILHT